MNQEKLDARQNAYRSDLADVTLRNHVQAACYVDGHSAQIAATTSVRKSPEPNAMQISQALRGETAQVFEVKDGWAWVQLQRDSYVGYIQADMLANSLTFPSHVVTSPRALLFPTPDLKTPPIGCLYMGSELSIGAPDGDYVTNITGGFIHSRTIAPVGTLAKDYVSVAERFMGTTYLWGGKTADGLDCSGLVQIAMHAAGMTCPRDSDMQMSALGTSLGTDTAPEKLQRGDLVFWDGHVGIMRDESTLLHANAWHMETAVEPFTDAVQRIGASGSPVLDIRRP